MASPTVENPIPDSASPGTGSVRDTDPAASTTSSYGTAVGTPSAGTTVAVRASWSTPVTRPVITRHPGSSRRNGTTTCRGSSDLAAASGRNGWYVMVARGSTT